MKRTSIRAIAGMLILCMAFAWLLPMPAAAATGGAAQRWNIMLVIDGSGSLDETDDNEMRYEAISGFLSVLQDSGHNVGSIVFTGNSDTKDTSDKAVRDNCIKMDTGINPISGQGDKNILLNQIKNAPKDLYTHAATDIGTALQVAAEELAAMNNGLPGAIYLFTDGMTAFFHNKEILMAKSNANRDQAIDLIQNNGIKLCGVLLDAGGKMRKAAGNQDSDAARYLKEIVSRANGVKSYDEDVFENYYVEIKDSSDLIDSIDLFLRMLGFGFSDGMDKEEFFVPGVGVEEVSIWLRTKGGRDLPDGFSVTLVKEDGTKIDGSTLLASSSRTLNTYKIQDPDPGLWKINVVRPENSPVEINVRPIMSPANLGSRIEATPQIPDFIVGQDLSIECYLEQNGAKITGKDAYRGYICTLSITDCTTGKIDNEKLNLDPATGTFTVDWNFDHYNEYDVSVRFELDEEYRWENIFSESAAPEHWVIANHLPKLAQPSLEESYIYSLFFGKNQTIDLTGCAVDDEDGTNLTYSVTGDNKIDMAGVTLDGTQLKVQPPVAGSGVVELHVTDSDGGAATMTIEISSHNITWLIILLVVALIVVIIIVIWFLPKPARPNGACSLSLSIEDWSGFGASKLELNVSLSPPGFNGTKHNTNLYEMLRCDMTDEYSAVKQELSRKGFSEDAFTQMLQANQKLLESYKVSCVNQKVKDEDGMVETKALLKFLDSANKHAQVLGTGMPAMVNANTDSQAVAITFDYLPE